MNDNRLSLGTRGRRLAMLLTAALTFVLMVAATSCGGDQGSPAEVPAPDSGGPDVTSPTFNGDSSVMTLTIQPSTVTLTGTGAGATQQFKAYLSGSPTPVTATWLVTTGVGIGTLDGKGLYTTGGKAAGIVLIQAQVGSLTAQAQLHVILNLSDNAGNVSMAVQQQLMAGGTADPAFGWLYPYDQTVFPRGLLPPVMQFGGTPPDATYVHVSFSSLDYKGFYGPSNPGQVPFTAPMWATITQSASGSDAVKVELTKISGGMVSGPITETWTIAQGSLKGTVYYESRYSSPTDNGATMRIKPGAAQPDVMLGNCNVCHYVSADGSTIVADLDVNNVQTSAAYDLKNSAAVVSQMPDATYAFGALYKDGSLLVTNGSPSHLYDVKKGMQIPAPGWDNKITSAALPSFSPSGKMIAFNHEDTGMGHTLAVMGFDVTTHTFSGLADVANDPNSFLGWPTFTPDDRYVVYENDTRSDFGTRSAATAGSGVDAKSDLQLAQISSSTSASLDRLNGFVNGKCYLPFGEQAEGHMNYDPTILPVAVGGYFWVVFTSRREYGNTINNPDPYYNADNRTAGALPWRKKLWVAAIDIDSGEHPPTKATDISHPAFYLDGQDLQTGNYRGFWALSPCQQNGVSCESGDECCTGFCRQGTGDAGAQFVCVPGQGCANEYEKCTTTADCCGAAQGFSCIAGFCALPVK